jgi:putative heme-binding domain-containing protein
MLFCSLRFLLLICAAMCGLLLGKVSAADAFDIKAGDRVVILGDTLFEREGVAAALESRLYQHFAPRAFSVRNLSFAADRPDGVSRASFDPPAAGKARLHDELSLIKPTVVIIGYGMAASLEELTYRSGDSALNPDPERYGRDFSSTRFAADLTELMDKIKSIGGDHVRFVLFAPIRHEDLRSKRPHLPDPSIHEAILQRYRLAIASVAAKFNALYLDTPKILGDTLITDNGIHPSSLGLERWADGMAGALGWTANNAQSPAASVALRAALQYRNDLFFHRWRPANYTYLFGFRKHEQGRNAKEMEQFDALLQQADAIIAGLVAGGQPQTLPIKPAIPPSETAAPDPGFIIGEGLTATLFAANPMISKPLHLSFDGHGRMWVTSTPIYPQIEPGAVANDRIFIVEDTNHDGFADKSTVFADDLLIPSSVAPIERADGTTACYVGASTDLMLLSDTNGDGKADQRRTVLSGFGTEDTHHMVHTLYWGHDGRLYFNQSVYIHSHLETPWGVVRLNAGGVFAYEPASERVEVLIKGLWNTWGHSNNVDGQSFFTDGAGSNGISWGYPGAVFHPSEGARGTMSSISPGSYPKFCGLELIDSPLFSADWQGHAITCDFRAHRMVRMRITDLSPDRSGYVTNDEPDLLRTGEAWFRPVDVKHGPDGALYIADWTNPVINHGEVDFRDPRRDKEHGRIWRVAPAQAKPLVWTAVAGRSMNALCDGLLSQNTWERDLSRRTMVARISDETVGILQAWAAKNGTAPAHREVANILFAAGKKTQALAELERNDPGQRAIMARWLGQDATKEKIAELAQLAADSVPRVRVEALSALARTSTLEAAEAALIAVGKVPANDVYYDFAVTHAMRSVSEPWLAALMTGTWPVVGREGIAVQGLLALPSEQAAAATAIIIGQQIAKQKSLTQQPWLSLIAHAGNAEAVSRLFAELSEIKDVAQLSAGLQACSDVGQRGVAAPAKLDQLSNYLDHTDMTVRRSAIAVVGAWRQQAYATRISSFANDAALRADVLAALQRIGKPAVPELQRLLTEAKENNVRHAVLGTIAKIDGPSALTAAQPLLLAVKTDQEAAGVWRVLWPAAGLMDQVVKNGLPSGLSHIAVQGGLTTARELGRRGEKLEKVFLAAMPKKKVIEQTDRPVDMAGWVALVKKAGDPARGEAIYFSQSMSCVQCHAIGGIGGQLGPDMSTIGASAPLDYIIESVQNPAAKVKEGYHAVNFRLKDGSSMMGIPYNETEREIKIRLPGLDQTVVKDTIIGRDTMGSLMPPGLLEVLPLEDQVNMYAFLSALGKPGQWDASDGRVARQVSVQDQMPSDKVSELAGKPTAISFVDGRFTERSWRTALSAIPVSENQLYAIAVLDLGNPGVLELSIEGSDSAWIDGIRLNPEEKSRSITAGRHTIGVRLDRKNLPKVLRIRASIGRFVVP